MPPAGFEPATLNHFVATLPHRDVQKVGIAKAVGWSLVMARAQQTFSADLELVE